MRKASSGLGVVMLLVACGGKSKDKFDDALVEMDALATRMCTCADTDCRIKVQADMLAFRKGLKDRFGKDKASEAQEKRGRGIEDKLRGCRTRGAGEGFESVLARLADSTKQMCACTDKACSDQVHDGWKAYRATMKERLGSGATPSDEQDARGKVLDAEMKACRAKFETAVEKPLP
jgi:hypothetical protein